MKPINADLLATTPLTLTAPTNRRLLDAMPPPPPHFLAFFGGYMPHRTQSGHWGYIFDPRETKSRKTHLNALYGGVPFALFSAFNTQKLPPADPPTSDYTETRTRISPPADRRVCGATQRHNQEVQHARGAPPPQERGEGRGRRGDGVRRGGGVIAG